MSILSEITRLEAAKEAIATAIAGKGVTVPAGTTLDGMAALINSIAVASPAYTNQLPLSIDSTGAVYNNTGFKSGYRLNSSGAETAASGMYVSGFIPVQMDDIVRFANLTMKPTSGNTGYNHVYLYLYDSSFARITPGGYLTGNNSAWPAASDNVAFDSDGNVSMVTLSKSVFTAMTATTIAYMRFSAQSITSDTIVTVNEEIA